MSDNFRYRKNPDFPNRYISPQKLFLYLQTNYRDSVKQIGTSYLGKPIYMMTVGTGSTKILAWSQMHGNEANATLAMLDLLEIFRDDVETERKIFSELTLDFIFMLNPDGSEVWSRRNAMDIDMNRDFFDLASTEFPVLKNIAEKGNYQYGFNLHEQRTIFTTDGLHPATLSFLAPSVNHEREITENRKKAMALIAIIYEKMKTEIPHQMARYTDEFYPTSTGDNFTRMGLPTILFEGGHSEGDYKRENTRKYYTQALFEALKAAAALRGSTRNWKKYFEIPENIDSHYDLIYRNVKLNTTHECILDIAVQYQEEIGEGKDEISFKPIVVLAGNVGDKKGWKEIDCTGKKFICRRKFPKLDAEVDFRIE